MFFIMLMMSFVGSSCGWVVVKKEKIFFCRMKSKHQGSWAYDEGSVPTILYKQEERRVFITVKTVVLSFSPFLKARTIKNDRTKTAQIATPRTMGVIY